MNLLIHAANLHGLGARQVGRSILQGLFTLYPDLPVTIILPDEEFLKGIDSSRNADLICHPNNYVPGILKRIFDIFFGYRSLRGKYSHLFVLGDIPFTTDIEQWVLVHQPNIAEECTHHTRLKKMYYAFMRCIFGFNSNKCKGFFVQSDAMESALTARFPKLEGRVHVIPHTIPAESINNVGNVPEIFRIHKAFGKLLLFYPCAGYPHKNHILFSKIGNWASQNDVKGFTIGLTLTSEEVEDIPGMIAVLSANESSVVNLGRLSYQDVLATMGYCDGIFVPSLLESYCLPLIEGMKLGKYVLVANLPYAQWMCEDQGIYFNPYSVESAMNAIEKAIGMKIDNIQLDWVKQMEKIPNNWNDIVERYVKIMGLIQ